MAARHKARATGCSEAHGLQGPALGGPLSCTPPSPRGLVAQVPRGFLVWEPQRSSGPRGPSRLLARPDWGALSP